MKFELALTLCVAVANCQKGYEADMLLPTYADGITYKLKEETEYTNITDSEFYALRARSPVSEDDNLFYGVGYTDNAGSPTGDLFQPVKDSLGLERCLVMQGMPPASTGFNEGQLPKFCNFNWGDKRCCNTSHDIYIKNAVDQEGMWPSECSDKKVDGLEELFCFVCDPKQPEYTDFDKKIYRVCESLIKKLYDSDDLT